MIYCRALMPQIVVGVVLHPQRLDMAERLGDLVDADLMCMDRERPASEHMQGCAHTHSVVLHGLLEITRDDESDWLVVLEDDAVPVPDFRFHAKQALNAAPAPIVGLYLGTSAPSATQQQIRTAVEDADTHNNAWILADCLIGSVGYAIQTWAVDDILEFIEDRHTEELPLRITRWAQHNQHSIAYTQPSLVDHDDGESIGRPWRGPGFPKRKAWRHGTREKWSTPATHLGHCPIWSG